MAALHISHSVGIGGKNIKSDVKSIQVALNQLIGLLPNIQKLAEDGNLGSRPESSKTVAAINAFQKKVLLLPRPDGLVTVNSQTYRKMKEKLLTLQPRPNAKTHDAYVTTIPWMKTAFAEVGQAEASGSVANPRILEYFQASKFWGTDDSGGKNAWCGSFVAWVIKQHGYHPVKEAYRAKEWMSFGNKIDQPVHGAIGIKTRRGGGHVAFVVGQSHDGQYLYMLGGNQSNQVSVAKYRAEVWDTFVIPNGYDMSQASLPVYTKKATLAGSEA